jgi:hypothetical protein
MGRRKIKIKKIDSDRARKCTFSKRYPGLLGKAWQLAVLCDQDTFLFVRDRATSRIRMYSSTDEHFMPDYSQIRRQDRYGPGDMGTKGTSEMTPPKPTPIRHPTVKVIHLALPKILQYVNRCQDICNSMCAVKLAKPSNTSLSW